MNNLSDKIRRMRIAQGLNQTSLAKLVGITQAFMSEIEKGKKTPSVEVLEKICGALNCSADYLLGTTKSRHTSLLKENDLPKKYIDCGLSLEILQEVADRNISEADLKLALQFVQVMKNEKNKNDN